MLTEKSPPFKLGTFNGTNFGKRWGVHCNLRDRMVGNPSHPLPSYLLNLITPKLNSLNNPKLKNWSMNEANAIEYKKNQGHHLTCHVDDRFLSKEPIVNLSLNGDCYMTFTRVKNSNKGLSKGGKVGEVVKGK